MDRFLRHFAHTRRSILDLGLLLSLGFRSWVILPIRFRPYHASQGDERALPLAVAAAAVGGHGAGRGVLLRLGVAAQVEIENKV